MLSPTRLSTRGTAFAAVWLACLVAATGAAGDGLELVPAISTEFGYDSNVTRSNRNEEDDGVFRLVPSVSFRKPSGDLRFDANYQFGYEKYLTENISDGDNHIARLTSDWRISDRTELSLRERFAYTRNLNDRFDSGDIAPGDSPDLVFERERQTANNVSLALSHRLRPRWQLDTEASHELLDDNQQDRESVRGSAQSLYLWTPRLSAGFGGGGGYDSFEGGNQTGNRTVFTQGFLVIQYALRPDITLSAQGGPAWRKTTIAPSASSTVGGDRDDSSIDGWGAFSIAKTWERANASLSFSRSNSGASANRSDTVLNSLTVNAGWRPAERWRVTSSGNWSFRKADSSFGGVSNDEDTNTFVGQVRVSYQLARRASIFWFGNYQFQDTDRDVGASPTRKDFRTFVGFKWEFDPVQL